MNYYIPVKKGSNFSKFVGYPPNINNINNEKFKYTFCAQECIKNLNFSKESYIVTSGVQRISEEIDLRIFEIFKKYFSYEKYPVNEKHDFDYYKINLVHPHNHLVSHYIMRLLSNVLDRDMSAKEKRNSLLENLSFGSFYKAEMSISKTDSEDFVRNSFIAAIFLSFLESGWLDKLNEFFSTTYKNIDYIDENGNRINNGLSDCGKLVNIVPFYMNTFRVLSSILRNLYNKDENLKKVEYFFRKLKLGIFEPIDPEISVNEISDLTINHIDWLCLTLLPKAYSAYKIDTPFRKKLIEVIYGGK